jgi:hypothetical protein
MATIKTAGGKIVTKIVNGVRRISCSCCCFCRSYDLDLLLYGDGIGGLKFDEYLRLLKEECGDIAAWEALQPSGQYIPKPACLRWLCRETSPTDSGPVTTSTFIGGPTTNDRDLNDLLLECMGERSGFAGLANGDEGRNFDPEEYGRCYLYGFEFYGWWKKNFKGAGGAIIDPSDWIGSDFYYNIYRRDTAIPAE